MRRTLSLLYPVLVVVGCGPGEQPPALECGEGTEDKNGTCVAVVDPIASCGDGTIFDEATGKCETTVRCADGTAPNDDGECVPLEACGPGTELDLASGECIPSASCGPGTVLDEQTGECVPEVTCGAGTELTDDGCVALGTCAEGAVLDLDSGLCVSHISCGPGQVVAGGQCVAPNVGVGLEADVRESATDANDPSFGGTPEPLELEALGEKAVFVGNIDRPADVLGDGVLQQDRDVWSFEGRAGQYLRVSVLGTGLPQPAFIVEGPNAYRRSSALLSTNDAVRELVLPYDGVYQLAVVPTAYVSTGLPVGSTNSGYVGVIETLGQPTPTTVVPSTDIAVPAEVSGNLRDLSDNFLLLDADVGDAVQLTFEDASEAMPPAVIAFDASGNLLTHVDLVLDEGSWVGTLVKEEPGTLVVVDWQSSTTSSDAYLLKVHEVPHVQGGTIAAGSSGQTAATAIQIDSSSAFTVTLAAPTVLSWDVNGAIGPDLQIQSDGGTYFVTYDEDASFFYGAPGSYTFFVYNDYTSTADAAVLTYGAVTPLDLGVLDVELAPTGSVSGHLLAPDLFGPDEIWMIVESTTNAFISLAPHMEAGDAELAVYDTFGVPLRGLHRSLRHAVHAPATPNRPVLVVLQDRGVTALDWTVTATAEPIPVNLDVEPNDASSNAIQLGTLPASALGTIAGDTESDRFQFTLEEPLEPGQTIEVHVENLSSASTSATHAPFDLLIYDALDQVVPLLESQGGDNLRKYIPGHLTQTSTTFFIDVSGFLTLLPDDPQTYLLEVRVVDTAMEIEPNDTAEEADVASSLPASWYGYTVGTGAADYFEVALPDIPASQAVRVRYENLHSSNTLGVALESADGTELVAVRSNYPQMIIPGPVPGGTYRLRVEGPFGAGTVPENSQPYRLSVEVIDAERVEREPNDDVATATEMGTVARGSAEWVVGGSFVGDNDWFTFTLAEALAGEESIQIRALNLDDGGDLTVELYDLGSGEATRVAAFTSDRGVILSSTPTGTGPFAVRVVTTEPGDGEGDDNMDPYYLRVEYGAAGERGEIDDELTSARYLGEVNVGDVESDFGITHPSDADWFTFTVDPALPAGQGLWVTYDTYYGGSAEVRLYDATDPQNLVLLSHDSSGLGQLVTRPSGATLYAIEVVGVGSALYDIFVETGPDGELEPNDDDASATPVGALPASLYAVISDLQTDVFRLTLDSDLAAGEALEVTVDLPSGYDLELRAAGSTTVLEAIETKSNTKTLSAANLGAGDYTVTVRDRGGSGVWASTLYQITIRTTP